MREHDASVLRNKAIPLVSALLLVLLAVVLLTAPSEWMTSVVIRIVAALLSLMGAALLVGGQFARRVESSPHGAPQPRPRPVTAPPPRQPAQRPHISSQDLLKTAAEQKKTIEELRATVHELEKQLAGMRLQAGIEVEGQTVTLWSEEFFTRVVQSELWRSRRTQRPMSLLMIDFMDENAARSRTSPPGQGNVQSSLWQYYAETVRRAVRGGDQVGLAKGGVVCVLLPDTPPDAAKTAQERITKQVEREHVRLKGSTGIALAVDTAVVGFPTDGKDLGELLLAGQKTILRAQRDRRSP